MEEEAIIKPKKIKFGLEIFYGNTPDVVPYVQLSPLDDCVVASYTGPDSGLAYAEGHTENIYHPNLLSGVRDWNLRDQRAYGICISLYEQHPISNKVSGEPLADSFAMCVRRNNAILMVADGVNWGEKSRTAARCALYGAMKYLNYKIFERRSKPENTQDVVRLLRKSVDEAHRAILAKDGGVTTLCIVMVCPVANSDQNAVCCVNVGDSFAYIYAHNRGIREVTVGSHDIGNERDIRDAGGAVGPVDGQNPELHNLTCSVSFCNKTDIVFLTTDGISDNFDPVVTKVAIPMRPNDSNFNTAETRNSNGSLIIKPEMSPKERHIYAMKEMERVVHEYELVTEEACSAQAFCGALLQHVLTLTNEKRKILENPALYAKKKMTKADRQQRDSEIVSKMSKAPGKLDHASVIAYEVGSFVITDENESPKEISSPAASRPIPISKNNNNHHHHKGSHHHHPPPQQDDSPPTPTSLPLCGSLPLSPPSNHHHNHHHHNQQSNNKKSSGPRKLFARLKSHPTSPTSPTQPHPPDVTSPPSSSVPTSSATATDPFRSFSPPPNHPPHNPTVFSLSSPQQNPRASSTPASPQQFRISTTTAGQQAASSSSTPNTPLMTSPETRKGSDLQFSPRKFPKRTRSRTSEPMSPTSPTIPEASFEDDSVFAASPKIPSQSRQRPRSSIVVFESYV